MTIGRMDSTAIADKRDPVANQRALPQRARGALRCAAQQYSVATD
jgi:hypothetical protein